jgi:hypothetical protein
MRFIHVLVIAALVFAAAHVYRIKLDSTVRAERVIALHGEVRKERDAIAALRAEWAKAENPMRLQGIVERHTPLKAIDPTQYVDSFKALPERPPQIVAPDEPDPIGAMIDKNADNDVVTGSVPQTEGSE